MFQRSALYFGGIFFLIFLFLTPLGIFNSWIPPDLHRGFYSVTTIDRGDDTGYYAFLRSTFIDGDLDFFNERGYAHAEKINPTGYVFNNWQMGQAILFLPFFLVGHALAHYTKAWVIQLPRMVIPLLTIFLLPLLRYLIFLQA